MDQVKVAIGIQARSTSRRFPGKCFAILGDKPVLQHVIDSAQEACDYLNKYSNKMNVTAASCLLIPTGDGIKAAFDRSVDILEGPEDDVLARYDLLCREYDPDLIVRITGDCPMIPSYVIVKHIKLAMRFNYDYISNVDERIRTSLDGLDTEVISRRLMDYISANATHKMDREHVTTLCRRSPPEWAKVGHVVGYFAMAEMKLSVDTMDDLDRARNQYEKIRAAIDVAEGLHGKGCVHRF